MKTFLCPLRLACVLVCLGIRLCLASATDSKNASGPDDVAIKLNQLIVAANGDRDHAISVAAPVISLASEDLRRSGVAGDVQEALRKLLPQFTGSGNVGAENASNRSHRSGGGSGIALRNLPTLVLFNGRRLPASPIGAHVAGNEFFDLNIIPLSAVRSVEILGDSGSAIFGANAVGGVVNLATGGFPPGGGWTAHYEVAPERGGWESRGAGFFVGGERRGTRLAVSGSWSGRDRLWRSQRAFSDPSYGNANFSGQILIDRNYFVLNPALAAPPRSMEKPRAVFPMTEVPRASDGRPYFGAAGSEAVYWGKLDAAGRVMGFSVNDLSRVTSREAAEVAFNQSPWTTLLQGRETQSVVLAGEHALTDRVAAFGDILASRVESSLQQAAQGFGATYLPPNPNTPFDTPTAASTRVLDLPRQGKWKTEFGRIVAGLRGRIGKEIHFDTAVNLNRSRLQHVGLNQVVLSNMRAAISEGRLNLFPRFVPLPEIRAAGVLGTATNFLQSELYAWDGRAAFEAFRLPGGVVQWNVGADLRGERLNGVGDENALPHPVTGAINWGGGVPALPFAARRRVSGAFVSIRAPIIDSKTEQGSRRLFDVTLAVRAEHSSDIPNSVVPVLGLRWVPWGDELTLRLRGGRSFNAPTLYQMAGAPLAGSSTVDLVSIRGEPSGGIVHLQEIGNRNLRPERGYNGSAGLAYSPAAWKGFSVELDYVRVKLRDVVGSLAPRVILQDVETKGADSRFVAGHARSEPGFDVRLESGFAANGVKVSAPGQIAYQPDAVYLTNPFVNLEEREVEALDLALRYRREWSGRRAIDTSMRVTYTARNRVLGAETAGRASLVNGTNPRWHGITTIAWRKNDWEMRVLHRAVASVFAEQDQFETGSYQTIDLGLSRRFGERANRWLRGLEVSLRVKNIGDTSPRRAPLTFPGSNADTGIYDPLGRTFLVTMDYRF